MGDFASEEVIARVEVVNRRIKDCETGRLRVVKQVAYNKLVSINLNNNAAYETGVEDGSFSEQSGKAEKDRMCIILFPRHACVGGDRTLSCAPIASHDYSSPT